MSRSPTAQHDVQNGHNEREPLLPHATRVQDDEDDHTRSSNSKIDQFLSTIRSTPTHIRVMPVIFLTSIAYGLPTLTTIDIVKRVLCQIWYMRNKPDQIPDDGDIPDELCLTHGPVAAFSAFMVTQAVLTSTAIFFLTSFIGQYAAMIGRKPILVLVVLGGIATACSFLAALFVPNDVVALVFLAIWLITSAFSHPMGPLIVTNLMVIDTAPPDERTTRLALVFGAMVAGDVPAYSVGGFINRVAGPRVLLLTVVSITLIQLLYTSVIVKETFGGDKRDAARKERRERRQIARERSVERWAEQAGDSTRGLKRVVRKTSEAVRTVLDPVTRLQPVKKEDGRWNYRLVFIGVSYSLVAFVTGYVNIGLIAYLTIVLRRDPEQNGITLTWYSAVQFAGSMVFFPLVSKWGRIFYARMMAKRSKNEDSRARQEASLSRAERSGSPVSPEDSLSNPHSEYSSAHFDVYLLRWSWSFLVLFFTVIGFVKTTWQLNMMSAFFIAFGGAHPTIQAVTAASVNPIQAGEVIAGLEMVGAIARFVSPFIFGALQTKLILTIPLALWMIMMVITLVGVCLTFFIRDEDRYIPTDADLVGDQATETRSH